MKCTQSIGKVLCEEFCPYVYEDKKHNSILVNVDAEWFPILSEAMKKVKYRLVHSTEMPKTVTAVYQKS